jgi:hypothetical protein
MSAGSDASNLGYGNIVPNSNVNPSFVNRDSSNYPGGFGSNEIPGLPGLAGAKSNVDAAASYVPGICLMKGGAKKLKRKIKNITKQYKKMKGGKKTMKRNIRTLGKKLNRTMSIALTKAKSVSRSLAKSLALASRGGSKHRRSTYKKRHMKGGYYPQSIPYPAGYGQYQNNLPLTPTYSVGGVLSAKDLGLANPPPISVLSNCTNCVDNYDHYTNKGFASRGH